ncbi:MAG: hypothetical protein F6K50_22245 [Moorea sp. SIO3I7]|nr:hypothetical protein [Moorena sp. SIO3I7]
MTRWVEWASCCGTGILPVSCLGRTVPILATDKIRGFPSYHAPYATIPDSRFPIPDSRFPIPDSLFPIPYSLKLPN